jgi:hypothetical protein
MEASAPLRPADGRSRVRPERSYPSTRSTWTTEERVSGFDRISVLVHAEELRIRALGECVECHLLSGDLVARDVLDDAATGAGGDGLVDGREG